MGRLPRPTGPEWAILGLVAVLGAVALLIGRGGGGGGEKPRPAVKHSKQVPVAVIAARVEGIRRLRFEHRLHPRTLSQRQARREQLSEGAQRYPTRRQHIDEEELKLLGLLRPRDSLRHIVAAVAGEQVLGYYDDKRKRLVVVRQGKGPGGALEELTLSHELTHALEDQRFRIGRLGESRRATDDESSAGTALVEGTATLVMGRYARGYMSSASLLLASLGSLGAAKTKIPPAIEDSLLFPYEDGLDFVRTLYRRGHGWKLVNRALRSRPPRSTEQVLHPGKYFAGERPRAVAVTGVGGALAGWRRLDATGVGEFDLKTIMKRLAESAVAGEAASGWGGGRLELWRRGPFPAPGCHAPCVRRDAAVLRVAWDTRADRRQFEAEAPKWFVRGLRARTVGAAPGVGLWRSRGGAIAMRGTRRETTIVWAPTPRLAARVAALPG